MWVHPSTRVPENISITVCLAEDSADGPSDTTGFNFRVRKDTTQMPLEEAVEAALEANDMAPSEEVREAGRVVATLQD